MKILCVFGEHNYGDPNRGVGYEYTNFIPSLRRLGHDIVFFESLDKSKYDNFSDLNRQFLTSIEINKPDLIFCVLMNYEIWTETLTMVKNETDAVIINWATDDSWKYEQFSRFMVPYVDWYTTTYPDAVEKSFRHGYNNVVLTQWAANTDNLSEPVSARECRWDVSFVGMAYGNRTKWVSALKDRGINVNCFGYGWENGTVPANAIPEIIRKSVICLNFGDSNWMLNGLLPYRSRQIKARVFEVPGYGGFLMTESADNLENFYEPGREIVLFNTIDELAAKIRYFLANPEHRDKIAMAGHAKTRRKHTYDHRFRDLLSLCNHTRCSRSVTADGCVGSGKIDFQKFHQFENSHRLNSFLKFIKLLLVFPCNLVWGPTRGPRAARRILFELSWRLCGKRTYSASGWPGRLFYNES